LISCDLLHTAENADSKTTKEKSEEIVEAAEEEMEENIMLNGRSSHNVPSDVISSILGKKSPW